MTGKWNTRCEMGSEAELSTLCFEEDVQRPFLFAACNVSVMTTEAL